MPIFLPIQAKFGRKQQTHGLAYVFLTSFPPRASTHTLLAGTSYAIFFVALNCMSLLTVRFGTHSSFGMSLMLQTLTFPFAIQ